MAIAVEALRGYWGAALAAGGVGEVGPPLGAGARAGASAVRSVAGDSIGAEVVLSEGPRVTYRLLLAPLSSIKVAAAFAVSSRACKRAVEQTVE